MAGINGWVDIILSSEAMNIILLRFVREGWIRELILSGESWRESFVGGPSLKLISHEAIGIPTNAPQHLVSLHTVFRCFLSQKFWRLQGNFGAEVVAKR